MGDRFDERSEVGDSFVDPKALLSPSLASDESILWTGRPDPTALSRLSRGRSFRGLIFVCFTLVWMYFVIQGGNNNWDRGRAVRPFATHNVIIAACAGLWLLPPGVFMLTGPLQARWIARRTRYILTDQRAVIIEPGLFRGCKNRIYSGESLALTRCEERPDGSGDLVFENRKTAFGMSQAVGFVGVERVRDVEALLKGSLPPAGRPKPKRSSRTYGDDESVTQSTFRQTNVASTYKLKASTRTFLAVFAVVFAIGVLCMVIDVLIFPLLGFWWEFLGVLVILPLFTVLTGWLLTIPVEITIDERSIITLRGLFRTRSVAVGEIGSISTGGWRDPNRFLAEIRHRGGNLFLINHFPDFRDFLAKVKAQNPQVDIKGF